MDEKKSGTIAARIGADLQKRLEAVSHRHGVSNTMMVEDALSALADLVEREHRYIRPMRMEFAALRPGADVERSTGALRRGGRDV